METKIENLKSTIMASIELDQIGKALMNFQANCPPIEKNTKGYGYMYADLAQITETIKPHLQKAGLSYTQLPFNDGGRVGVKTILIHPESGQRITATLQANLNENNASKMTPIQQMGSIITYLRRYSISSILSIVSDEDIDGANVPVVAAKATKAVKPKPVTKPKVTYLTSAQLTKALESDIKGIQATIKAFSTETKKLKASQKTMLEKKLAELQAKAV